MTQHKITELTTKFNVIGTIYQSDFFKEHGKKSLYQQLELLYRSEYSNQDRIIIVQDCADVYEYADMPGQALSYIQQCVSKIDISNFFLIVVSGNKNIQQELEAVRTLYSTDHCCMQHLLTETIFQSKPVVKKDTFCVLPWMHLYIGPDGNVLPCCHADHQHPLGNIEDHSVTSIIQSPAATQLRANMLAGLRSKECKNCYLREDQDLPSPRAEYNIAWADNTHVTSAVINDFTPKYLDIRLNNICNLKCRMCSGYFSSAIAREEVELFGTTKSVDAVLKSSQRSANLNEIIDYLPSAEKIYFAGGEPLLTPEHYQILQALIDCGNTDLELSYNTNFTTLKFKSTDVTDLWAQFKHVRIGASLDAGGNVAEYVRHGSSWSDILNNVAYVKNKCPNVEFTVTSAVGFMNVASLIELQKTWHQTGILDINKFSLSVMTSPDHLTVCVLPSDHKQRLATMIQDHIAWCSDLCANGLASQWHNVLKYMLSQDNTHHLAELRRLTLIFDQHRNESFDTVFPEYKNLI